MYQAAVWMLYISQSSNKWIPSPDKSYVYRGQRKNFPLIPTIFRDAETNEVIKDRFLKVSRYITNLVIEMTSISKEQALAVIQHYSTELDLQTWLLDFTWDPFVALFFSSLNSEDNDIGMVFCIEQKEWNRISSNGLNRFGKLRVIEVSNIHRINAQRALFLNTTDPSLFEQYIAESYLFKQHSGLVFEDKNSNPSITEETLLPKEDPIIKFLKNIKLSKSPATFLNAPSPSLPKPLISQDYYSIILSWCDKNGWKINEETKKIFDLVNKSIFQLYRFIETYFENSDFELSFLFDLCYFNRIRNLNQKKLVFSMFSELKQKFELI